MPAQPVTPPAPASQTIEEVFLTPRVLDRRAFEDYAESLKRLIKDATGEGQSLSRTAADVRVLRDQLAAATAEAQRRLDATVRAGGEARLVEAAPGPASSKPARAKAAEAGTQPMSAELVRAIEARIEARVEARLEAKLSESLAASLSERLTSQVLDRVRTELDGQLGSQITASAAGAAAQRLERDIAARIDAAVRQTLASAAASVDAAASTQARLDAAVAQAADAIDASAGRVERLAAALEDRINAVQPQAGPDTAALTAGLDRAAASAAERASGFERSIEAAARRFASETNEQGARVTAEARAAIEAARTECEAAVRQITTGANLRVRKAQQDVEAVLDGLERQMPERLAAARAQFEELLGTLTSESQERAAWIKAALADLAGPKMEEVRGLIERAAAHADGSVETSLAAAVGRAEAHRAAVDANIVQIEELAKQVGLMRDLLARSILEGVGRVDALDARQEELLASTARAIEQYAHEIDTLRASMAGVSRPAAEQPAAGGGSALVPETGAALAEAEERLDHLKRQTDEATQAAEWLAGLIDRAARAGIALDEPKPAAKGSRRKADAGT